MIIQKDGVQNFIYQKTVVKKLFKLKLTHISTLAGTARAGIPLNNQSKQTQKLNFSPYEPEHLELDHK